ncbi:MAG: dTDP-4-dehydrorhamnose reductase [Candidatus Krumholzibacteriia bacterium]
MSKASSGNRTRGRVRVVVTGADGMLGRSVVDEFGRHHEVLRMRRSDCDLADPRCTLQWIAALAPHVVVHCAAWTDVDGCESDPERAMRENAFATRNVALATQDCDAALCYISTDYVFDGSKEGPYREDDPIAPLNVYGRSKRIGEEHVLRHVRRSWVVRTSWLYGPGGTNFVRTMSELLPRKDELRVVDDQVGSPTYTLDLAVALRALVDSGLYGVYHITNTGTCSWYELARAVEARLRTGCRVQACRSEEFPRPATRPRNSVLDAWHYRLSGLPLPRPWNEALGDYLKLLEKETAT